MSRPPDANPPLTATSPCPCTSGRPFGDCCQPLLQERRLAENAEMLMRSRFTAHALRDYAHLHRTDLETARQTYVEPAGEVPEPVWTRLVVHAHETGPRPDVAYVDFTAYYKGDNGGEFPLHEKSEFKRVEGAWFYTRAIRQGPPPVRKADKAGRNDPCPCGSGKKFKHCCGR
jgi:SEC-C motif domain protein